MPTTPSAAVALESVEFGRLGLDYITDTSAHTGVWGIIECKTNCTFTTLEGENLYTNGTLGNLNSYTLTAGQRLYGVFTKITLTSGSVVAYRAA